MGEEEVIFCSKCKGEDCTVIELREKRLISMEDYADKHQFSQDIFSKYWNQPKVERKFVITCQDCGHQKEYRERVAEPPIIRMKGEHDGT